MVTFSSVFVVLLNGDGPPWYSQAATARGRDVPAESCAELR